MWFCLKFFIYLFFKCFFLFESFLNWLGIVYFWFLNFGDCLGSNEDIDFILDSFVVIFLYGWFFIVRVVGLLRDLFYEIYN